ncbi:MAG: TetR/AcrR family transcriptional regulator [Lachnospiraceae bacterium]|nr:TetR/AcrR family transcriptional regulator [Lachnospiraceae bacterium]
MDAKINKKQQFINCAYEILQTEGIAHLSIRRLAKEMGCTSTVLYSYFDNVEHLITIASVRYLEGYIADFKRITNENRDPLELNIKLWERFSTYALENVDIFEMLFFGKYKENLVDIIYEYYEIFSQEFEDMDGLIVSVMFNGDLRERDYIMYRRAASMGYIDLKMAATLAQMDEYMFHGMLMKFKNRKLMPEEIQEKSKEFTDIIRMVIEKVRLK